jgi:hypothetical protein
MESLSSSMGSGHQALIYLICPALAKMGLILSAMNSTNLIKTLSLPHRLLTLRNIGLRLEQ